jgi:3-methyladenine DNA glycosylase/8-oxoguanine DNA glycosylase
VGHDPTTLVAAGEFWRATLTPAGPATLHVWWTDTALDAEAWGPGAPWMLERVPDLVGVRDEPAPFGPDAHPAIVAAQRQFPGLRLSNGHCVYHTLIPTIIAQRVTTGEARRSWRRLCLALGAPAPGPVALRLPPCPQALAAQPYWWYHRFGIEKKRADTLRQLGRHGDAVLAEEDAPPAAVAALVGRIPGIGPWTIGASFGHALGDPDAVAVGDFHLKNFVAWTLAGEPRATDERMLELLSPYAGQRGRVIALLGAAGWGAPRFGPGLRVLPIERM